jgi:hypothetical protein
MKNSQLFISSDLHRSVVIVFFFLMTGLLHAAHLHQLVQDVSRRIVYQQSSPRHNTRLSYLKLSDADSADYMMVSSREEFSVFVKNRLWKSGVKSFKVNPDSIHKIYGFPFVITFVTGRSEKLILREYLWEPVAEFDPGIRIRSYNVEFVILAIGIILIIFAGVVITNARNFLDYFRFLRLFDTARRDDTAAEYKIRASKNTFVYLLTGFLTSFIFTIYHFSAQRPSTLSHYLYFWTIAAIVATVILVGKILIVKIIGWIYGFENIYGQQIFGTIRMGIFLSLISAFIFLIRFFTKTEHLFGLSFLPYLWAFVTAIFYLMFFMRARVQMRANPFQLFSYLCISELFPLVFLIITIKP